MEKPFLMTMFLKTKEVEVVPRVWLFEDDGKNYCYWPNFSNLQNIYTAARNQDVPNRKVWKRFAVRIFHQFESYEEAEAEIPYFLDYSDYDAAGTSRKSPSHAVSTKSMPEPPTVHPSESESDDDSVSGIAHKFNLGSLQLPSPPSQDHSSPVPSKAIGKTLQRGMLFPNVASASATALPIGPVASDLAESQPTVPLVTHGVGVQTILQEIHDMKSMCCRNFASIKLQQANLVIAVENLRVRMNAEVSNREAADIFKFGFPFKELQPFLDFEEKIKADASYREGAKGVLSKTGGGDVTEVTNNVFRKLISDSVSGRFTMYGTAEKSAFVKLETFELIVDAIRSVRSTRDATETEIKKACGSWLLHAFDRIKSHQKSLARKGAMSS